MSRLRSLEPAAREQAIERRGLDAWRRVARRHEDLRAARLCAWLRQRRRPDGMAGYSILIYRLDDAALAEARLAPPSTWHPGYEGLEPRPGWRAGR